jgi:hypothetical protein
MTARALARSRIWVTRHRGLICAPDGSVIGVDSTGPRDKLLRAMCPLQNLAGVAAMTVAPSPAASIGDATISSVGHRPSSIFAPNRDQQFH